MISLIISLLLLVPIAHGEGYSCAFVQNSVSRSGPLPYAGTLKQQRDFIEKNEVEYNRDYPSEKRTMKVSSLKVDGSPAYRFIFRNNKKEVIENIIYNKEGASYQLTLVSDSMGYRKEMKRLRTLLKDPYGESVRLCEK